MATQLTWSHYTELLSIKDNSKLQYYLNISMNENLSKREVRNRIKNNEYERLPEETKDKLVNDIALDLCQVFRHDFLSKSTVFKFIPISF